MRSLLCWHSCATPSLHNLKVVSPLRAAGLAGALKKELQKLVDSLAPDGEGQVTEEEFKKLFGAACASQLHLKNKDPATFHTRKYHLHKMLLSRACHLLVMSNMCRLNMSRAVSSRFAALLPRKIQNTSDQCAAAVYMIKWRWVLDLAPAETNLQVHGSER
eukprot:2968339-Amphidinium_carterae.1